MTDIQYWRPYSQQGINVFETSKDSGAAYNGLGVRIGGGFTQSWQSLSHENPDADTSLKYANSNISSTALYPIGAGFNNASANLFVDAQLARGVRLNLTLYLSSRHHQETWVKGGYLQVDDLSFLGVDFLNSIMDYLTIRVGHMEVNYGDAHFRRSDGGQSMYNPFIENYMIDAFTTEIGADITAQAAGFLGVVGVTNGEIKGNISPLPASADNDKTPAIYAKLGYDNRFNENFRFRLTGSMYTQGKSPRNTLFFGDRTGSHYFMVMEKEYQNATTKSSTTSQAWSGRLNPNFADHLTAFQFNTLVELGLGDAASVELFGTYEMGSGNSSEKTDANPDRDFTQIAADLIFRFGKARDVFVGGRFNTVNLDQGGALNDTDHTRIAIAAGWYILDYVMLKGEYVSQTYSGYGAAPSSDYRAGGSFNGVIFEAVVGF